MTLEKKAAALTELIQPKLQELGLGFVLLFEDKDGERAMLSAQPVPFRMGEPGGPVN